jgi:hypothetical protein
MPEYKFQQMATVWYQVIVEADNEENAIDIGLEAIAMGDGEEVDNSFELQDETWIEEQ